MTPKTTIAMRNSLRWGDIGLGIDTDPAFAKYLREAAERMAESEKICKRARRKGLNATPEMVNRKLRIWRRWYTGNLATGYLRHITGVTDIPPTTYTD